MRHPLLLLGTLAACASGGASPGAPPAPAADTTTAAAAAAVREAAIPVTGAPDDYDALLELVGDARVVLLGEATHGTHEFYRERARITRRLVEEKGFTAVAVEGDWPDAARVDRYVRGGLRAHNRALPAGALPATERASHYFHALLPDQFDAVIHVDRTSAVRPL